MLELNGLSRRYGDVVALEDLSLSVDEGQVLGFVGPNGSGKTTTMRIALGVLEPDRGEVRWRGDEVGADARRRFGYMPEERGLYPKMRVDRQLRYFAALHGLQSEAADRSAAGWIDRLGLQERGQTRVEELSLGNQQRVQLGAALVHDPDVLVLDEPFSGLDPTGVDLMSGILFERAREGAAVIFSSHQLELVERLCETVALIDNGRLVAAGRVDDLRSRGAPNLLRVEVEGASREWADGLEGVTVREREGDRVVLELDDPAADQQVLDAARSAGRVRSFEPVRPTLAELFRKLVGREESDQGEAAA